MNSVVGAAFSWNRLLCILDIRTCICTEVVVDAALLARGCCFSGSGIPCSSCTSCHNKDSTNGGDHQPSTSVKE